MQHGACDTKCTRQWGFGGSHEGSGSGGVDASPQHPGSLEVLPKYRAIRGGVGIIGLCLSVPQIQAFSPSVLVCLSQYLTYRSPGLPLWNLLERG